MTNQVDVLVLGGGPGGYVAAIRAAQRGLSVAVVETKWWGGVCLNVGCIPTKTLLRNAEIAGVVRQPEFGIDGDFSVDYGVAWRRSREVADRMAKGVSFLLKKNRITALDGWGCFTSPHTMTVRQAGDASDWTFEHAIIATGASPKSLPGVRIGGRVMTYEQFIMSEQMPQSLIIAGSGAIGVEFATVAAAFGSDVTIVEYVDRLVPGEDPAISRELARAFRKRGISFLTGTAVQGVDEDDDGVTVHVNPVSGGEGRQLRADALLLALGFAPSTSGFGLETTGVTLDDAGFVATDDAMRTAVPHIFAVGDVTGKLMLAHVAQRQGVIAAETIAGSSPLPLDYTSVPRATYCEPSIGSVGLTAVQAEADGHVVKTSRFPFSANGKAQALGETAGFVLLVADATSDELLGAHLIGPGVTEMLPELVLAKTWGLTADQIAVTVHAHPSLSEAIMEAAEGVNGSAIDL